MNIQELIALANLLDEQGEHEAAGQVDAMIQEAAYSLVPDDDEEFRKEYEKEHGHPPGQVYVGKPTSELPAAERESAEANQKERMMESMHRALAEAGYDVFRPGELDKWLKATGHVKLDRDKWPSTTEMMGEEDTATDPEYAGLMENAQGEINMLLEKFLENPSDERAKIDLLREIEQYAELSAESQMQGTASLKPVFEKLADLADRLDKLGASNQADMIDAFVEKYAEDVMDWQEADPKGERAKAYDSKYHHSMQVREPKKDQERVDFEGRKDHHVSTYESGDKAKETKKEAAPHGALQTRYSPDLVGVQMARIGDGVYQCPVTGKIYNFETGYTDMDGDYHPGSSVSAQTPDSTGYSIPHRIFDSREQILNRVN